MKRIFIQLLVLMTISALTACVARPAATLIPTNMAVPPSHTAMPTLSPAPTISLPAFAPWPTFPTTTPHLTPTEFQLPFNDKDVESEYCQSPAIKLSVSAAHGLSDNQIAGKLMDLWLAYFNAPQAPDWCRIDGYKIDKVYYDAHALAYPPVEPQGDIMRVVRFSIKLIQVPNMWMSLAGEVDQQNWLHTVLSVAVFRSNTGYTMKFANP
jgi:hypothetical protein